MAVATLLHAPWARLALVAMLAVGVPVQAQIADVTDSATGETLPAAAPYLGAPLLSPDAARGSDLTLVGRLADGETRGIDLVGTTLYRSNGGYLEALDVSTPTAPTVLGRFLVNGGVVQGASIEGGLAYVPVSRGAPYASRGSIQIVDVSDPANMQSVGAVTGRSFFDVQVSGTTAFAAGGGLRAYDVSNPAAPVAQGVLTVSGGSVLSVALDGTTAYITAGNRGLRVVDVSNPAALIEQGSVEVGGFATDVVVQGTTAYVSVNNVGMAIVDVSNPAAPALLGTYPIASSQVRSVAVSGTTAYVGRDDGFMVVDVTNPAAPAFLGEVDFGVSGSGQSIVLDGTTAYVGNRFSGVRVVDIAAPTAPTETTLIPNGGFSFKVNVIDNRAYVADLIGQVRIIDLSDPTAPVLLGRAYTPPNTDGVDVIGTTAYVVDRGDDGTSGLTRVDISDPANPILLGTTPTGGAAFGLDVGVGDLGAPLVYVANGYGAGTGTDGSVLSINVSGTTPLILDDVAPGNQAFDVRATYGPEGDRVYVALFGSGLSIFDATNPSDLAPLSLATSGNFASSLEVDGTTVYLADSEFGSAKALTIVDATNATAPTVLATADGISGGTSVDVAFSEYGGGRAFTTVDFVGLYEYDVSDPTAPVVQPVFAASDRATGVDAEGRLVVFVDAGAGLWVFQTPPVVASGRSPEASRLAVAASPNPTTDAAQLRLSLGEAAPARVEVFSVLGARVAQQDLGPLGSGAHTVDLDASAWAAGIYIVRLTAGGQTATTRLTVTR